MAMQIAPDFLNDLTTLYLEHPLFLVGLLLIAGYFLGRLFGRLNLPEISGFILAGLLVNLLSRGHIHHQLNDSLHVVTEAAIGLLAMSVGAEFSARKLRRIGRNVVILTLFGLVITFVTVYLACLGLGRIFPELPVGYPYAVLLAVVACATAPAIIVAEVHHLRAHGRFIDYLFGTVVLGDAVCVVIFGLAFPVVMNVLHAESASLYTLTVSLREILFSMLTGAGAGLALHLISHRIRNPGEYLIVTLGVVFVMTGVAIVLHLSPLLANMVLGAVLINLSSGNHRLFKQIEPLTPPIYALFFVIAGIELNPAVFLQKTTLLIGLFYIIIRAAGRYAGSYAGTLACGLPAPIRRNLGFCMLSQGGIALGFVLLIQTSPLVTAMPESDPLYGVFPQLVNIILISIFINEIASPFLLKPAIIRGNEMEEL
jgi:Kef-type K+ transport system membrane component KefB